ncbi:MAG: exodeoxyribonuclease V subunit alpha [Polyangiaceae bacterium]
MAPLPQAVLELHAAGVLGALDVEFARVLERIQPSAPNVLLAAALTSRAVQRGHVCLDLRGLDKRVLLDQDEQPVEVELPGLRGWLRELSHSALVATPATCLEPTAADHRPLVLDARGRVYLWRYYDYQTRLAANLLERLGRDVAVDEQVLARSVSRLFAGSREDPDLQRVAALVAASSAFSLISGGPGTGKTTTVVRILATLIEQSRALGKDPPRILLLAPTGKASQRLAEAITEQKSKLTCESWVSEAIPTEALTIHRALGYQPHSPTRFRYGASEPLSADCVLVDESSMVDLALLTKLVEAVPRHAQLILIGDKDQLSSVETGAILGDVFNPSTFAGYSPELVTRVASLSGDRLPKPKRARAGGRAALADCMVHLTKSYRYSSQGGIGALARAINAGDARAAWDSCQGRSGVSFIAGEPAELEPKLGRLAVEGYRGYLAATDPARKLEELSRFRMLTAHRRGRLGVEQLNQVCERALADAGLIRLFSGFEQRANWYPGQPILVTQNDYQLGLFNGDIGVVTRSEDGRLRAWFWSATSGETPSLRGILPARLPPHETVYAMTVHKSQGSEFDQVALVLPPKPSPILTRELIYTAVTRAKAEVTLVGQRAILEAGVSQRIRRASGLSEALWGFELPEEAAVTLPTAQRKAEQLKLPF